MTSLAADLTRPYKKFRDAACVLLLTLLVLAPRALHAQSTPLVQGVVTDSSTGQPLDGVSVANCPLYQSCGSSSVWATTDSSGAYTLTGTQIGSQTQGTLYFYKVGYFTHVASFTINTTINVSMVAGGPVLTGSVTDSTTGAGVAGAQVVFQSPAFVQVSGTHADAGGNYVFDSSYFKDTAATGFTVTSPNATATGYFSDTETASVAVAPPYPIAKNFVLQPASGIAVQGVVTDSATGQPVSGVSIATCAPYQNCAPVLTTTDASGGYTLTGTQLFNQTQGTLYFYKAGYFTHLGSFTINTPLNVSMIGGGAILQGSVTDSTTGAPIAGAQVVFQSPAFVQISGTHADANGNYAFDSSYFRDTAAGGFTVTSPNATATGYFSHTETATITVAPPYPIVKNFVLQPASGIALQGVVTDSATGQPLSGVSIATCAPYQNCAPALTTTDASGGYSLTGTQLLNQTQGTLYFYKAGYFTHIGSFTINTPLNVPMIPGGAIVQGIVSDASTGAPLVHAQVVFQSPAFVQISGTYSDANGKYVFDSSYFRDTAASGFTLTSPYASATGYSADIETASIPVAAPFPAVKNFPLQWNGTQYTVVVDTVPTGLPVTIDGTDLVAPQTVTWRPSNSHTIAVAASITPTADSRQQFVSWSNGGPISQQVWLGNGPQNFTATFQQQYLLTTSVSSSGAGTVTAGGWFNAGATTTVQATANSGYTFTGFSGSLTGTANPQSIAMNAPATVTAGFAVTKLPTTTTISSFLNPAIYGENVTFTAVVTSAAGTPSGTVTFADGATALGTATLNAAGAATLTVSTLAIGGHNITATYSGATNYNGSTSAALAETVNAFPAGIVLVGTVTNRATGAPVAGANVHVYGTGVVSVKTDANGQYTVTGAQYPYTTGQLFVDAPGYYSVQWLNFSGAPTTVNVTMLSGGAVLQGTVRDSSSGSPVASASLTYSGSNTYQWGPTVRSTTADATGVYKFDASEFVEAALTSGTQGTVKANAQGYVGAQVSVTATAPYPQLDDINLLPGSQVVLQGTITNRVTGAGIAGANVHVYGATVISVQTDATGHYAVTGNQYPNTSGQLFVDAAGYYSAQWVNFSGAPTTGNVSLQPGGPVLQGRLKDSGTGAAVAGASVSYSGSNTYQWGPTVRGVQSDGNGVYTFDSSQFVEAALTSGTQGTLKVQAQGYVSASSSTTAAAPYPFATDFNLVSGGEVILQGTVTDRATGAPLAGVNVHVYGASVTSVQTDAKGHYSVTGTQYPNTSGQLFLDTPGYYSVQWLNFSGAPTTVDVKMLAGGAVLQGTLRDSTTGALIGGASLTYSGSNTYQWGPTVRSASSDSNGVYQFDSSQFVEAATTGGTQGTLGADAQPSYYHASLAINSTAPSPLTNDIKMTPTGSGAVSVTVGTSASNVAFQVDGTSYTSPQTFTWVPHNVHTVSTTSPQSQGAGTQSVFTAWSDGGAMSHSIVAPGAATTYTANFGAQYLLTTSASPSGAGTVTEGGWANAGSTVTVAATPASGYTFDHFSGDVSSTTNPLTVTMDGAKSVVANFVPQFSMSVAANPASASYPQSVAVTATITPASAAGTVSFVDPSQTLTAAVASGTATANFSALTPGTHTIQVTFTSSSGATVNGSVTVTVAKGADTIAFGPIPNHTYGDAPFAVSATGGSTQAVVFAAAGGACSVSGATVTITAAGTCQITASQAGDSNYNAAANVTQGFTVAPAAATLSFGVLNFLYDGTAKAAAVITSPANIPGVTVTYNGGSAAPVNAGTYAVAATLNNPNYTAAPITGAETIAAPTPAGTNVQDSSVVGSTTISTTFSTVSAGGATTVTPIAPSSAGTIPGGFDLAGTSLAFDVSTTASYPAGSTITNCFVLTSITDPATFANIRILHREAIANPDGSTSYVLIDRTVLSGPYAPNFSTQTVCAQTYSLSPFVVAKTTDKTPPSVTAKFSADPVQQGTQVTLSATATDTQSDIARIEYSLDNGATWKLIPAAYYAATSLPVSTVLTLPAGAYGVCVRAADAAQNIGSVCEPILAVYNPAAGSVNGSGWIQTASNGKGTFAIDAAYKNGASQPTGSTQFTTDSGGVSFASTAFSWLVVSGAQAEFAGSGTYKGAAGYSFLVTAIDGKAEGKGLPDRFRIKIWNTSTGAVAYDSQQGSFDNAAPTVAVGGGNVTVH